MIKTKPVFLLLALFFSIELLQAQTLNDRDDNTQHVIPKKSWEVGTDLLWLIDKNNLPANNLLLRRNYTTENGIRHAWRLRIGVDVSSKDSVNINDPVDNQLNETYLLIRMGHEWQYLVEEKALLYFGGDLQFIYDRTDEKRLLAGNHSESLYQETLSIYIPSISVLIGARYHIKPWLSISMESTFEAAYRIRRNPFKTTSVEFPDSEGDHGFEDSETVQLSLFPISNINLTFHF